MDDGPLDVAHIRARSALHAVLHAVFVRFREIVLFRVIRDAVGHEVHGAYLHAASALDARGLPLRPCAAVEEEDAARAFDHGDIRAVLRDAHHGPAHDQLRVAIGKAAAAEGEKLGERRADANAQVPGLRDTVTADRENPLYKGLAEHDRLVDGKGCADVLDNGAHVEGQAAAGNLAVQDGLDELLFRALGVLHPEGHDLYGGSEGPAPLPHVGDGIGLVHLNGDDGLGQIKDLEHDPHALDDALRVLDHQAVVRGKERLAFNAIDDEDLYPLFLGRGELHVGGERCAAQADDAGLLDNGANFIRGNTAPIPLLGPGAAVGAAALGALDHDRANGYGENGVRQCRDRRHGAGNTGVHGRGDETGALPDFLAGFDRIPHFHDGLAGSSGMLLQRHDQPPRKRHVLDLPALGPVLVFGGMNPSAECMCAHIRIALLYSAARKRQ